MGRVGLCYRPFGFGSELAEIIRRMGLLSIVYCSRRERVIGPRNDDTH